MKKKFVRLHLLLMLSVLVLFVFSSNLFAMPQVSFLHWNGIDGGIGGYYNSPPTNGAGYGEVYPHGDWACEIIFDEVYNLEGYADGSPLITFCLEINEELIGESDFYAITNSGSVNGGVDGTGYDELDTETAWLYDQYLAGNTFGITDLNRRAAVIQEAMWYFEGELDSSWSLYTETSGIITMATDAVANGWINTDIVVLNVYWSSDSTAGQDVLAKIPEPATLCVLALGSILLRKRK